MLRKTLTILSLIGLLLSVGLWGVSRIYALEFVPKDRSFGIDLTFGIVRVWQPSESFLSVPPDTPASRIVPGRVYVTMQAGKVVHCAAPGVSVRKHGLPQRFQPLLYEFWPGVEFRRRIRILRIPLWMPCLVFAALPAYSLPPIYRRRKRKKLGLCVKCGYDPAVAASGGVLHC